jgi:subtilisin family serine protease
MKVAMTVGVLVVSIMVGGDPSTAAADDGRRLLEVECAMLDDVLNAIVKQLDPLQLVIKVLHVLSFDDVCALGVKLSLGSLDYLVGELLKIVGVVALRYDPLASLTPVDLDTLLTPVPLPEPPEAYDWGMEQILVPATHADKWKGSGVTVAVVDTGVYRAHPAFKKNSSLRVSKGFNAVADEGGGCNGGSTKGGDDNHGHGTHMAGIIGAARNDSAKGVMGAAPEVNLVPVKVLNNKAQGYLSDFLCGLQWVYNQNVRLVNISVGFWNDKALLKRAIQSLYNEGFIMIAAAGNKSTSTDPSCVSGVEGGGVDDGGGDGEDESISCDPSSDDVMFPAAYNSWVIGVAATKYNDREQPDQTQITYYTRHDPGITVAAPGGERTGMRVLSTRLGGGYAEGSGTSQATAHVTGAVALALGKSSLNFKEVRDLLQGTAWKLANYSGNEGYLKLINAHALVESTP